MRAGRIGPAALLLLGACASAPAGAAGPDALGRDLAVYAQASCCAAQA